MLSDVFSSLLWTLATSEKRQNVRRVSARSGLWDSYRRKYSFSYLVMITVPRRPLSDETCPRFIQWRMSDESNRYQKQYVDLYFIILCFPCSGSASQMIKVYNLDGGNLSTIRYHEGFMGQRIGPISCLEFHPHRVSGLIVFVCVL